MAKFSDLKINQDIKNSLQKIQFEDMTPIQEKAIEPLLNGRDVIGIAQTGSGKTAAFSIPLIHKIANNNIKTSPYATQSLILVPTRELALQILESIKSFGKGLALKHVVIVGGLNKRDQTIGLSRGADIIIATPGRLTEFLQEDGIDLSSTHTLIIDETDRMLDMGFRTEVEAIMEKLPIQRQNILFSATMSDEVNEICEEFFHDVLKIETNQKNATVDTIEQEINFLHEANKVLLLKKLVQKKKYKKILVFTNMKKTANEVQEFLEKNEISSLAIHSDKKQSDRLYAIRSFTRGQIKVLVATDIAARGIDIDDIDLVINFDIPNEPENYVHRIGRTARANKSGRAISFCHDHEKEKLQNIEEFIKFEIPINKDHIFHGVPPQRQSKHGPKMNKQQRQQAKKAFINKKKKIKGKKS